MRIASCENRTHEVKWRGHRDRLASDPESHERHDAPRAANEPCRGDRQHWRTDRAALPGRRDRRPSWVRSERHATHTHRQPTSGARGRSSSGRQIRALRARIEGAKASAKLALASFDGVVLGALRDAETSLNTYVHDLQREDSTRKARDEVERAVRDSERLQAAGRATALTVIDS
jgi:hypothetical protein